jgi:O-glycosyl hydrolase
VLVAINRGTAALTAAVRVTAAGRLARVERWQLTAAGLAPARLPDAAPAARNALRLTLPPRSVSTLVLRF